MSAGPDLPPTQQRLLAITRRGEPLEFDPAFVARLKAEAVDAIADFSAHLGGESLWVTKAFLSRVHGCEVAHLAPPDDFEWKPSTAAGFVAHRAIELALNWRGEPAPGDVVDEAIARIGDEHGHRGDFVAGLTDADRADLRSRAVDRTTKFLQDFPPLPATAHPVLESSARWKPPGTIEFSGKADLVVGRPQGRESRLLIIDFKTGGKSPHHRADLRFYDRNPVGRLMTRITSDVETLNELFSSGVVTVFGDLFTLVLIVVMMLRMDWRLALVTLAVLPLVVVAAFVFRARIRDAYRDIRVRLARINAYLHERITGVRVVQLFNREDADARTHADARAHAAYREGPARRHAQLDRRGREADGRPDPYRQPLDPGPGPARGGPGPRRPGQGRAGDGGRDGAAHRPHR